MSGGEQGSQFESGSQPCTSVSLSCGWNKLRLIALAVPMVAAMDESPFTVKLSDAQHTHASRERKASCNLAVQPGMAKKRHKILLPAVPVVGKPWVRVHHLQLPPSHISS